MAASLIIYFVRDLNYGVDFKGGTMIEVQSKTGPADIAQLREKLGGLGIGGVQIQSSARPDVLIRVEQQAGGDAEQQEPPKKVLDALGDQYQQRRF